MSANDERERWAWQPDLVALDFAAPMDGTLEHEGMGMPDLARVRRALIDTAVSGRAAGADRPAVPSRAG
ncbi:MAG: hypothetical protein ABL997_04375 [Planctomycetota bacterium]